LEAALATVISHPVPMGMPHCHLDLRQFSKEKSTMFAMEELKTEGKIPCQQCISTLFLVKTLKMGKNCGKKTKSNYEVDFRSGFGFMN
jgi:hypothetical protein